MYYGGGLNTRHGVGVIVTKELAEKISYVIYKSERIIIFSLKLNGYGISFIQVYAPQQGRPQEEKEDFFRKLQETKESVPFAENIIIMGDLNGHVGCDRTGLENVLGQHSIGERNREGENILDFCVQNQMSIMNTYYKHQESHKWTWYRWNSIEGTYTDKSMIDLVLTNNKKFFKDVKSVPSVSCDSDHRLILVKLKLKKPKTRRTQAKSRYLLENLNSDECKERFRGEISRASQQQREETDNPERKWMGFRDKLKEAASEVIQCKTSYGKKKKQTPWWTPALRSAVQNKMKKFRKWMKTRSAEDHIEYIVARRETEIVKRQAKTECWTRLGNDLANDLQGMRKLIYSTARNYRRQSQPPSYAIKDESGLNLLTEEREIQQRWKEHFETLLNILDDIPENENEAIFDDIIENSNEPDIAIAEVKNTLKKMKNGKAPGDDGLPVELLKNMGEDGEEWFLELVALLWSGGEAPEDWKRDVMCPIYKKGDKTKCSNYRGICLMSHALKVYERILEERLRRHVEQLLGEQQSGFRPGRGTTNMISCSEDDCGENLGVE